MTTTNLTIDEMLAAITWPTVMRAGVEVDQHVWGNVCTGTRDALVDADIYRGPFPGDEGQNKSSLITAQQGYERVRVRRYGRTRYEVELTLLPEEKARRHALQDARVAHAGREKALQRVQNEINQLPKTAAAYRAQFAHKFDIFSRTLRPQSTPFNFDGGCTFTPQAKVEINAAFDAVSAAILRADVVKSDRDLVAAVQEIKARHLRDDAATAFVQGLTAQNGLMK